MNSSVFLCSIETMGAQKSTKQLNENIKITFVHTRFILFLLLSIFMFSDLFFPLELSVSLSIFFILIFYFCTSNAFFQLLSRCFSSSVSLINTVVENYVFQADQNWRQYSFYEEKREMTNFFLFHFFYSSSFLLLLLLLPRRDLAMLAFEIIMPCTFV